MATQLYYLSDAQKATLEAMPHVTLSPTLPQTISSLTPGNFNVYAISDVSSGTVSAAHTVPNIVGSVISQAPTTSASNTTPTLPTHAVNDIIVIRWTFRADLTAETVSGWEKLVSSGATGNGAKRTVFYARRAQSTSETAPTFTIGGGNAHSAAAFVVRGVKTTAGPNGAADPTPAVKVIGYNNSTSTTSVTIDTTQGNSGLGVSDDKSLVVWAVSRSQSANNTNELSGAYVNADLANITAIETTVSATVSLGCYMGSGTRDVAAVIANTSATFTNAANYSTATLAFVPV